jgi:type IV secretory pathway component VirB8
MEKIKNTYDDAVNLEEFKVTAIEENQRLRDKKQTLKQKMYIALDLTIGALIIAIAIVMLTIK